MPAACSRARVTPAWYAIPTVPPPPKTMPMRREAMASRYDSGYRLLRHTQPEQCGWDWGGAVVFVVAGGGGELGVGAGAGGGGGGAGAAAWAGAGGAAVRWAAIRWPVTT